MLGVFSRLPVGLSVVVLFAFPALRCSAQEKPNTPDKALQGFKAAIEAGDLKRLAGHVAGEEGAALRKLADPLEKAKAASRRFSEALKAQKIDFKNPFAAAFQPLTDIQFELINDEIVKKNDREYLARVKYGFRGQAQEETVWVQIEEGQWRVSAPVELAKTLPSKDRLDRQVKGLTKLAEILDKLASEIEGKKLTTKEQVGVRLVKLMVEEQLTELLR